MLIVVYTYISMNKGLLINNELVNKNNRVSMLDC
jgi:hypothetical protein